MAHQIGAKSFSDGCIPLDLYTCYFFYLIGW